MKSKNKATVSTVEYIDFSKKISKNELLNVLKKEVSEITVHDIVLYSVKFQEDAKHFEKQYKENFLKTYVVPVINRLKCIAEDKNEYIGYIDNIKLKEFLKTLEIHREMQRKKHKTENEQDFLKLSKITKITSIYAIFILEIPIHPIGTLFSNSKLKFENKELCPMRKKNVNNPLTLCRFCPSSNEKYQNFMM